MLPVAVRVPPSSLLTITLSVLVAAAACDGPVAPSDPAEGGTVSPNGGVVSAHEGRVRLTVPAGAVSRPVEVTVDEVANPPGDPRLIRGTSYDFQPDGLAFRTPATMELRYADADLGGAVEGRLRIHRWNGSEWRPVAGGTIDAGAGRAMGEVDGFSLYAVLEDPCAAAPFLVGKPVAGRLTVGDCQVERAGEIRYEELFAWEPAGTAAVDVRLEAPAIVPGVGMQEAGSDPASALVLASDEPSEKGSAGFSVLASGGEYEIYAASTGAEEGDFLLEALPGSTSNGLGCSRGLFVIPPVREVPQEIDDASDCVVTIEHSTTPEVIGRQTVEEYFWIKVPAGATVEATASRTGGEPDFTPFPTLFLGGGAVVQAEGDPTAAAKTVSHTVEEERFLLLGVSSTLDGDFEYTQGSYTLSVEVR